MFEACEKILTFVKLTEQLFLTIMETKGFQFYLRKECHLLLESGERTKENTIKG